jgi:hypothetical protein
MGGPCACRARSPRHGALWPLLNAGAEQNAALLRDYVYKALSAKAKGTDATSYAK